MKRVTQGRSWSETLSGITADASSGTPAQRDRDWPLRLALAVSLAMAAHLLLSALGFSPTDDGFILAQSRRILSGEVPHRDFISIRPVGSAILHVPELLWGGSHAFLLSRFIYWLEAALGCWCWLEIARMRLRLSTGALASLPLLVLAFMLSTHAFPPMAWHTVDGVFLASLGFLLAQRPGARGRALGYALVGASALCKQSFLPLLPAAVILNGDARRAAAWIAVALPAAAYGLVLVALGAGHDLRLQLLALTDVWESGVKPFTHQPWALVGIILGAASTMCLRAGSGRWPIPPALVRALPWLGALLMWGVFVHAGRLMNAEGYVFIDRAAYILFGAGLGLTVTTMPFRDARPLAAIAAFALAVAWSSSVSLGYRTPALASGPLALVAALGLPWLLGGPVRAGATRAAGLLATVAVLVIAGHWWSARHDHIYHEQTAPALTFRLDGVLPGGDGIRTNRNTYAALADLREATRRTHGKPYAILVDVPGWWACAEQRNPLPTDWPQSIELCTPPLQQRFSESLVRQRGRLAVLVQKVELANVQDGFAPVAPTNFYYYAGTLARQLYTRTSETRYWTICE